MENEIRYIDKVVIKGLWGYLDLEWKLNSDVNVLAGANGSGKTTILNDLAYLFIESNEILKKHEIIYRSIIFNNNWKFEIGKNLIKNSNVSHQGNSDFKDSFLLRDISIKAYYISGIDTVIKEVEAVQRISDKNIKTELDWKLHNAKLKFWNYQINLGKKVSKLFEDNLNSNALIDAHRVSQPRTLFYKICNELFAHTGKKIDEDSNEIQFITTNETVINAYQLSSGEKQILTILLTVLAQDQKPSILFIDEPEVSLHVEWQKELIGHIRALNPNCQLIITTHSPGIIMNGWMDKVFNVQDLITNKTENVHVPVY